MLVTLIGLGGGAGTVTAEARAALEQADAVLGSRRMLDMLDSGAGSVSASVPRICEVRSAAIADLLVAHAGQENDRVPEGLGVPEAAWARPCVLYSGDTGFHSGASRLISLLEAGGIPFRVLPGLSSVQLLASRIGRPWQEWRIATAHGVKCDPVSELCHGVPVFFLTGPGGSGGFGVSNSSSGSIGSNGPGGSDGSGGPAELCGMLAEAGLGNLPVTIGENLSLPGERVVRTTAETAARGTFAPLSVLLAEAAPAPYPYRTPGIPDSLFVRGDVPMTKQLVRASILSLLAVRPGDTVWDIGAGTGSVSVELALAAQGGRVYAVERREAARELIRANRVRFGAWNLTLAGYEAPEALDGLPAPDAVFIGGTGGRLAEILDAVLDRNPNPRLCVSAVTVETLAAAMERLSARGLEPEAVQVAVSRTGIASGTGGRKARLFRAENPVFLIAAQGRGT